MTGNELKQKFVEKEFNLSWLAQLLNTSYAGLSRVAKKPIEGVVYEFGQINYDEIVKFCERNNLNLDEVDFDSYVAKKKSKVEIEINLGDKGTFIEETNDEFEVVYLTLTDVCVMYQDGHLRSMSKKRYAAILKKEQ